MNLTAIAIDDEVFALKEFACVVEPIKQLNLQATFTSVRDALDYLTSHEWVDMIFCDIEMPGSNGLEAAKLLSAYCDLFLFTTAHSQYALDAYQVGVDAYLLKPVNEIEVMEKIAKLNKMRANAKKFTDNLGIHFVKDGYKRKAFSINEDDILAIIGSGNYVDIITRTGTLAGRTTLKMVQEKLDPGLFVRISRSTIIAVKGIKELEQHEVMLENGNWYGVGRTYYNRYQEFQKRFLFSEFKKRQIKNGRNKLVNPDKMAHT